jgi:metal-dependent hydrolase (beta-lactamase superfamily II)
MRQIGAFMKLQALSHYDSDMDTRYGDCIMLYDSKSLIVYDCGHEKHAEAVRAFLGDNPTISQIYMVVSHNDSDHTNGVINLLQWLATQKKYGVKIFTHQCLKHVDAILDRIDDNRRNRESLKESLLAEFDNIRDIIETGQSLGYQTLEASQFTHVGNAIIVGPTEDEFVESAAQAVDSRADNNVCTGHAEETAMNAASVQLKCDVDGYGTTILCGDASPGYVHHIDVYSLIQLPHHGQLSDAMAVFDNLRDSYSKTFLISDNTGSGATSGGSDDLTKYMHEERYKPAENTNNGIVKLSAFGLGSISAATKPKGVRLGVMGFRFWN